MLWRIVYVQTLGKPKGLGRIKSPVKRRNIMGVEIVTHKYDLFGIRVLFIQKPLDFQGPVYPCALLSCIGVTPSCEWLREQKDAASAVTDIPVVLIPDARRPGCKSFSGFSRQLHRLLVHAYHWMRDIVRSAVHLKDVLHSGYESSVMLLGNAPALLQVGFIFVFFSIRPTCV